jgi:hypothetical protein
MYGSNLLHDEVGHTVPYPAQPPHREAALSKQVQQLLSDLKILFVNTRK